jgi:hypothetical protein
MAHKICPKCQSPAPLEATFCGQCGRQYRTQFVTPSVSTPNTERPPHGTVQTPNTRHPAPASIPAAILVMSVIVAALILMVAHRNRPGEYTVQTPRSVERPLAAPQLPTDSDAAGMVKHGEDPIEEEAKRVVERDNARLQNSPPATAVGPDGRVHLRGGGSITKEQWDDANRRLRNSPEFRDPMPPPPVN